MKVRIALLALIAAATALLLTGCLFSPRDPDGPPDEGSEIPWETPVDTSTVLKNLAAALAGEGTQNYLDCFADSTEGGDLAYRCYFDPSDSLDAEPEAVERYSNWRLTDEGSAVDGIFLEAAEGIHVSFTTDTEPDESQDVTYRREDYVLTVVWQSGAHSPGESVEYRGRATLWMRKDDTGRWAIFRWVDRRLPDQGGDDTWGKLRGDYRGISG